MPRLPQRLCPSCGLLVASGATCRCRALRKAELDRERPTARQRGYTSAWDKARVAFLAKHGTCARCGSPATVVNHKQPHRGDKSLFWDRSNWEPVCAPCHNGPIQSEEKRSKFD